MRRAVCALVVGIGVASLPARAYASSIIYSNLAVNNDMAAASRPANPAALQIEIEAADDFVVTGAASITEIKFKGLVTSLATLNLGATNLEFYRVFPNDSNVARTSGAPIFSTANVPTRVNSPSDVAFATQTGTDLASITTTVLNPSFTASNSVLNGIHPKPSQTTGGEGSVTGVEVLFDIVLTTPLILPADHYFFVPQIADPLGEFYWLSAERPITSGTSFPSGFTDLQAWIRNSNLDPDWLRIGTDIVGGNPAPTFNMAFELDGTVTSAVPEPTSVLLLASGLVGAALRRRRKRVP
jgi:hypothetical protein